MERADVSLARAISGDHTAPNARRNVWLAAVISALGGLLFGYDWVVIGGAKPFYEAYFAITEPAVQAWLVSCALVGCLLGAMMSGGLSDRFGRKPALLVAALLFIISAIGTAMAPSVDQFVIWRIVGGIAIGIASGISPLYIAEIAPAHIRGQMVVLNQIAIVVGILAAQIINLLIAQPVAVDASLSQIAASWNGQAGWRWMFAAEGVPALAFLFGLFLIPESPRWLAQKGKWDEAARILRKFNTKEQADQALNDIRRSIDAGSGARLRDVLRNTRFRKAIVTGIILAVLQQWCGINVIFNYAQEIFASAGYAVSDTLFNIVITGVVNCVFTLVALGTVERWGRRRLLLLGCASLAIVYLLLGGLYLNDVKGWPLLLLVVIAIACYAMTLAPVTWVVLAEIFPGEARGTCMAIATTALWAACFLLTYSFPLLNAAAGTGLTFWLYAIICAAGFAFIYAVLPETKGKALEEIERDWH